MGLKSKIASAGHADVRGFRLTTPATVHFTSPSNFETALKEQASSTALLDADCVNSIDVDGRVLGTDLQLSQAAFSDLCHWSKVPVGFIKHLAKLDEQQATEVMETMLRTVFHSGPEKKLVIDSRVGRIDGIVGKDSYAHIDNADALTYLLSAAPGLEMSNGWLAGPNMRVTAITKSKPIEAKKGDVVHFGVNLENSIHGDNSLRVADYFERLVCTNGAVARDAHHTEIIVHRGDIAYNAQRAVVKAAQRAELVFPLVREATTHLMLPPEIRQMRALIADGKQGGSPSLEVKVVKAAQIGASQENRAPEETTLWNWVNAITAAAHDTDSVGRKAELEALGYRALVRFGVIMAGINL